MSWLSGIFSKKPKVVSPDFVNPVTTELHSHLIPNVDDGVKSVEQTIEILQHLQKRGYKKAITTPHVMVDFYKNSKQNLLPAAEAIRQELQNRNIDIKFEVAAEYMVDEGLVPKILNRDLLTLGKEYVLIEMPFDREAPMLKDALFELQLAGYKPVLAHPERYPYYSYNMSRYEDLIHQGVFLQLNLFSMLGYYSPDSIKAAVHLVKNKMISFVGSDIHAPRQLPAFDDALHIALYEELCDTNKILNNTL